MDDLTAIAKSRRPRVANWWGIRGGATRKHAECYVCDVWIDTWAATWPMPKHAIDAIAAHEQLHLS